MTHLRKMMLEELQRRNVSRDYNQQVLAVRDCVRSPFWQVPGSARAE